MYTLSRRSLRVMNQLFIVTQSDLVLAEMGARIEVRYAFNGEAEPSVRFEPAMVSGQGWAAAVQILPPAGSWLAWREGSREMVGEEADAVGS